MFYFVLASQMYDRFSLPSEPFQSLIFSFMERGFGTEKLPGPMVY